MERQIGGTIGACGKGLGVGKVVKEIKDNVIDSADTDPECTWYGERY